MYPVPHRPNPMDPGARVLAASAAGAVGSLGGALIGNMGAQALPRPAPPADLKNLSDWRAPATDAEVAAWEAWEAARYEIEVRRERILTTVASAGLAAGAAAWAAGPGRRVGAGVTAALGAATGVQYAYGTMSNFLLLVAPLVLGGVGGGVGAAVAGRLGQ